MEEKDGCHPDGCRDLLFVAACHDPEKERQEKNEKLNIALGFLVAAALNNKKFNYAFDEYMQIAVKISGVSEQEIRQFIAESIMPNYDKWLMMDRE